MKSRINIASCLALFLFIGNAPCSADLISIGPFTGDASENFDSFIGGGGGLSTLDVFGGNATLLKGDGGSVKVELRSTRGGDTVNPRSPSNFGGQFAKMQWQFHRPISEFGGYFENNSRFDDIVVEFFDEHDQLIGTETALAPTDAQAWTWNGWRSDTPIHRIVTAGNDEVFLHGFVWYDDMEISFAQSVPEPSAVALLCLAFAPMVAGRRRKARASFVANKSL